MKHTVLISQDGIHVYKFGTFGLHQKFVSQQSEYPHSQTIVAVLIVRCLTFPLNLRWRNTN